MEPIWLMWGGILVAVVGFTGLWDPLGVLHLTGDWYEVVGRWLMRAGMAVATAGAATHIVVG